MVETEKKSIDEYEELALALGLHVDSVEPGRPDEKTVIGAESDIKAQETPLLKLSPTAFIRHFERHIFVMGFLFVLLNVILSGVATYYVIWHVFGVWM